MSKTYVIADLHGRYDLLIAALRRIAEVAPEGGKIVFTGDYIDRGPQSAQIIAHLAAGPQDGRWTWVCLKGNHEEMMLGAHDSKGMTTLWIRNGGGETLDSYGATPGDTVEKAWSRVSAEHIAWLRGLPRIHADAHRVFVHAGVVDGVPLEEQDEHKTGWMLYPEGDAGGHGDRHVVHGHHQFKDGPKFYAKRTNLDTAAWFTGRLVIGVFDDARAGGPVETITVEGQPHGATVGAG